MFGFKKRKAKEKPIQVVPTTTDQQTDLSEMNIRDTISASNVS